jgi:hypothetical protein
VPAPGGEVSAERRAVPAGSNVVAATGNLKGARFETDRATGFTIPGEGSTGICSGL